MKSPLAPNDIRRKLTQDWQDGWWFVLPLIVFPINLVCVFLTGGGHAPFIGYIPLLLLWGPLFLPTAALDMDNYYRWGNMVWISFIVFPSLLYLLYMAILRISAQEHRWSTLKIVAIIHLSCSIVTIGYLSYMRLHGKF